MSADKPAPKSAPKPAPPPKPQPPQNKQIREGLIRGR